MKYAGGALVLLLCAGSVIPAQMSSSANFLFVTCASSQSNNPAAEPSAPDKVTGYRDLVSKLQGKTHVPWRPPTFVPYGWNQSFSFWQEFGWTVAASTGPSSLLEAADDYLPAGPPLRIPPDGQTSGLRPDCDSVARSRHRRHSLSLQHYLCRTDEPMAVSRRRSHLPGFLPG